MHYIIIPSGYNLLTLAIYTVIEAIGYDDKALHYAQCSKNWIP